jgi:hypothetical protein
MGNGDNIIRFPDDQTPQLHTRLENWLSDCLNPASYGIDVKPVDGILLILVPESKTKPHQYKDRYYYRLGSTSRPMPELMISAMYRAKSVLTFDYELSFRGGVSLTVLTKITNTSRIAGTKPQLKLKFINLVHDPGFGYQGDGTSESIESEDELSVRYEDTREYIYTSTLLSNEILYPSGQLIHHSHSRILEGRPVPDLFIVRSQCAFLESPAVSKAHLVTKADKQYQVLSEDEDQILRYAWVNASRFFMMNGQPVQDP